MSFDDRIRDALGRADNGYQPGSAPTEVLTANVERRRRLKAGIVGGGATVMLALLLGLVIADNGGTPDSRLDTAAPARDNDIPALGAAADGITSTTSNTAQSNDPAVRTTTTRSVSATAGTAYAPPASVVNPKPGTSAPQNPTTTATAPAGDTLSVTDEDNGKTFTLRKGQHLVVTLDDGSSIWSDPDSDNGVVLTRTAVSANPSATHVTASFDAKAAGQAHVSASKDLPCRNAQPPCMAMAPTQLWQITVNVIG